MWYNEEKAFLPASPAFQEKSSCPPSCYDPIFPVAHMHAGSSFCVDDPEQRCSCTALEPWLEEASRSGIAELRTFAAGIKRDEAAVLAALTYEWSQGQVEGQVHRLKLLKRQSYGRAGFDLLRHRVLARSA
jgi:transposase